VQWRRAERQKQIPHQRSPEPGDRVRDDNVRGEGKVERTRATERSLVGRHGGLARDDQTKVKAKALIGRLAFPGKPGRRQAPPLQVQRGGASRIVREWRERFAVQVFAGHFALTFIP
jgi:hypothetical protein